MLFCCWTCLFLVVSQNTTGEMDGVVLSEEREDQSAIGFELEDMACHATYSSSSTVVE